ncbi:MAG TPA: hypothetical protein VF017_10140 [Thermoanaerobaculia bacterium]|nr:hypothetical protein [Thermoanaerobaculia bacterium]
MRCLTCLALSLGYLSTLTLSADTKPTPGGPSKEETTAFVEGYTNVHIVYGNSEDHSLTSRLQVEGCKLVLAQTRTRDAYRGGYREFSEFEFTIHLVDVSPETVTVAESYGFADLPTIPHAGLQIRTKNLQPRIGARSRHCTAFRKDGGRLADVCPDYREWQALASVSSVDIGVAYWQIDPQRVAKALRHLVGQCGGKSEPF